MQTLQYTLKSEQIENKLTLVSLLVTIEQTTVITFILSDPDYGRFIGQREFTETTRFRDEQDFIDEMWASEWLLKVE